jgi:hypothetical protein
MNDTANLRRWKWAFRKGLLPLLTDAVLEGLRLDLLHDLPCLIQGAIVDPLPVDFSEYSERVLARAGCLITRCAWHHMGGAPTIRQLDDAFASWLVKIDALLGSRGASGVLTTNFDRMSREEMRREFLDEVMRAQAERLRAGMLGNTLQEQPS